MLYPKLKANRIIHTFLRLTRFSPFSPMFIQKEQLAHANRSFCAAAIFILFYFFSSLPNTEKCT